MDQALTGFKGKNIRVPSAEIDGRTVIVTGRSLRMAALRDEELVEGELVSDPARFVAALKDNSLGADVFTFPQNVNEPEPKHDFPFEWDNAAVADTRNYTEWWEKKLPQETRKNVRRSTKKGVVTRVADYDDAFVAGIKAIYDETPMRQGSAFWHYGKDLESVRRENGTYRERCEYVGAYFEDQLIGFLRFVYVDRVARIMQILASVAHSDKRPMNALLAKGVEICHARGIEYLVYSKFTFGNKKNSHLAEFKRRNGFEEMKFPRYYVPLTLKGRIAMALKLHRGLLGILPPRAIDFLLKTRSFFLARKHFAKQASPRANE